MDSFSGELRKTIASTPESLTNPLQRESILTTYL